MKDIIIKGEGKMDMLETQRVSQVNDKLCTLACTIDKLQTLTNSLEERLVGVLLIAEPVGVLLIAEPEALEGTKEPVENLVPVAEEIKVIWSKAIVVESRLHNIIGRIEV